MDDIIRPKYRRLANAEVYARRLQNRLGTLAIDAVRPCDVSRMVADYARAAPVASRTACRSSNEAANDDAAGYALLAALALTVAFLTA